MRGLRRCMRERRVKKEAMLSKKTLLHKTKKFLLNTFHNLRPFLFPADNNYRHHRQGAPHSATSKGEELTYGLRRSWTTEKWQSGSDHHCCSQVAVDGEYGIGSLKINVERKKVGKEDIMRKQENGKRKRRKSLGEKMKELEMEDDVDQVLDIEEVLHTYSQLRCPIYMDIIDTFFTDMYHGFSLPQQTTTTTSLGVNARTSGTTLGPVKFQA